MTDTKNSTSKKNSAEKVSAESPFSEVEKALYIIDMHLETLQSVGYAYEVPDTVADIFVNALSTLMKTPMPDNARPRLVVLFDPRDDDEK